MNTMTQFYTTDYQLSKLVRGLKLIQLTNADQYWEGDVLKYVIIFDNSPCAYRAYRVTHKE